MILTPHLAGPTLRAHLSNRFGAQPLTLDRVSIAQRQSGASLVSGSSRSLTFGGRRSVTLPAGADVVSDPLRFTVVPFVDLAVSLYVPGVTGPATEHFTARQTSYLTGLTTGDRSADVDGAAFATTTTSWYFVDGIDVMAPSDSAAVVTFGDSITDGYRGQGSAGVPNPEGLDLNVRYPDFLQHRLLAAGRQLSVLNAGIGGNRILRNGGVRWAERRVTPAAGDAISQAGVTDVIILEGINDIGQTPQASAADIIAGLEQLVEQLHIAGLSVLLGTLTPAGGTDGIYGSAAVNDTRQAVNTWIRSSGVADGVVDFDAAVRDPQDPSRINPVYDGSDHLHFNPAGYEAMADAVNLAALQTPEGPNRRKHRLGGTRDRGRRLRKVREMRRYALSATYVPDDFANRRERTHAHEGTLSHSQPVRRSRHRGHVCCCVRRQRAPGAGRRQRLDEPRTAGRGRPRPGH